MTGTISPPDLSTKKALSLGIVIYAIFWAIAFAGLAVGFGVSWAVTLSLLIAVPFVIAVRFRFREGPIRETEFLYLLLVSVVVFVGSACVVSYWHDVGIDREHARYENFGRLTQLVRDDPAFRDINLTYTPFKIECGLYSIEGTVASKADLDRLASLAEQYGFLSEISGVRVSGNSVGTAK
jgi:hypothetical protein